MSKALFIAEKPSVAMEYVKLLNIKGSKVDGYIESEKAIFTWCVGHMVTMSYPEAYDEKLKWWTLNTLPFIPSEYKYEVITAVSKQFSIVSSLLKREDVSTIYVCTDSGREGEYIYRLVDQLVGVVNKEKKRVWIDSQTEEEIKRGIKEAKPLSEYDSLAHSAYLRAKEDYLLGINFSRVLTLLYGKLISSALNEKNTAIAVGRVMSCVLAMVVNREREIRNFKKTKFYKIIGSFLPIGIEENLSFSAEWKSVQGSKYYESALLYNENGFKEKEAAEGLIKELYESADINDIKVKEVSKSSEKKNAPLLFNLAELQNECSKKFKLNPDETLQKVQTLYEKKLLTYPRTDARVLSTAVAKEIEKNIVKLTKYNEDIDIKNAAEYVYKNKLYEKILKSKYVDDSKITDHYAIIPTGEGLENLHKVSQTEKDVYNLVLKRFLAIFYPPAKYSKISASAAVISEEFYVSSTLCVDKGYLNILRPDKDSNEDKNLEVISKLKKGMKLKLDSLTIKEGETSSPKRYASGSIIIAMENAGKLIEDEELREQIKGSGIGTSATRAEILKKLDKINYITINKKTQMISATAKGEMVYEVLKNSIPTLLNHTLTASWEKGLKMVAEKEILPQVFLSKLESYTRKNVERVISNRKSAIGKGFSEIIKQYYNNVP